MATTLKANTNNLYQNKLLMHYLANKPIWTTDNINPNLFTQSKSPLKVPLDAYALLHANKVTPHRNQADHPTLLTLNDLKALPACYVSRALFNNVLDTHILCVDAEADSIQYHGDIDSEKSDSNGYWCGYCQELVNNLPTIYREGSSHGGWHLLVYIPDDLLQASRYQDLFKRNIKFPFHTLEVFGNGTHAMTLTTKVIVDDDNVDINSEESHDKIEDFLDECLSQLHRGAYLTDSGASASGSCSSHIAIKNYSFDGLLPVQQEVVISATNTILNNLKRYKPCDYILQLRNRAADSDTGAFDTSKADWVVICAVANELNYEHNTYRNACRYVTTAQQFCLIVKNVVEKLSVDYDFIRDKWTSNRDGKPWLMYEIIIAYMSYGYADTFGSLE